MNLDGVDFNSLVEKTECFSGAELKAVCTEAGYFAIRNNRTKVYFEDFLNAVNKVNNSSKQDQGYVGMFG